MIRATVYKNQGKGGLKQTKLRPCRLASACSVRDWRCLKPANAFYYLYCPSFKLYLYTFYSCSINIEWDWSMHLNAMASTEQSSTVLPCNEVEVSKRLTVLVVLLCEGLKAVQWRSSLISQRAPALLRGEEMRPSNNFVVPSLIVTGSNACQHLPTTISFFIHSESRILCIHRVTISRSTTRLELRDTVNPLFPIYLFQFLDGQIFQMVFFWVVRLFFVRKNFWARCFF